MNAKEKGFTGRYCFGIGLVHCAGNDGAFPFWNNLENEPARPYLTSVPNALLNSGLKKCAMIMKLLTVMR